MQTRKMPILVWKLVFLPKNIYIQPIFAQADVDLFFWLNCELFWNLTQWSTLQTFRDGSAEELFLYFVDILLPRLLWAAAAHLCSSSNFLQKLDQNLKSWAELVETDTQQPASGDTRSSSQVKTCSARCSKKMKHFTKSPCSGNQESLETWQLCLVTGH